MGADQSTPNVGDQLSIPIPNTLKTIYPFLHDAHMHFIIALKLQDQMNMAVQTRSLRQLGILHVDYALKLISVMKINLSSADLQCLEKFRELRDQTAEIIKERKSVPHDSNVAKLDTNHLLLVEADAVLAIAEEQLRHGFRINAMLNFHVASIFYRLIDIVPPTTHDQMVQRLLFSSFRTMQQSTVTQNFIREHFSGTNCSNTYQIHGNEKLGKGSYGSVYLATHRRSGDNRAIKVMNVDNVTSYYLRKLHTEISVLKSIDHPNIIKLHEVYFGRHSVYLVTDHCRGGELFELLNNGKNQGFVFREDRAAKLMLDMLRAVHYLHSIGIVHRDLKLENFMFQEEISTSSLVLIDFGLSRRFEAGEKMTQKVGSCYYTAPEILRGEYDYRCDTWSLGVLCYMILSGSPPFFGRTVDDVYSATLHLDPAFPDNKFKHISAVGIDFIRRLLVKNPAERMTTGEALNHEFIQRALPPCLRVSVDPKKAVLMNSKEQETILNSIMIYTRAPLLVKLILSIIVHMIAPENFHRLKEEFILIDQQSDGVISLQHFYTAFMNSPSALCGDVDLYAVFEAMRLASLGGYGQGDGLKYHEYLAAAMCGRVDLPEVYMEQAFLMLDVNSSGTICAESVRKVLGDDFARTEFVAIFEGIPHISLQEFIDAWRGFWESLNELSNDISGVNLTLALSSGDASIASDLGALAAKDDMETSEIDATENESEDSPDMAMDGD